MLKTMRNWLGVGATVALLSAITAPVSAQQVIVIQRQIPYGVSQPPAVGSFIYGSPIPTPMPVNPATGLMPSYKDYSSPYSYSVRRNVVDSTLVNPILVNPNIRDSTLINPVIVNDGWQIPVRRRSRIIYSYPY